MRWLNAACLHGQQLHDTSICSHSGYTTHSRCCCPSSRSVSENTVTDMPQQCALPLWMHAAPWSAGPAKNILQNITNTSITTFLHCCPSDFHVLASSQVSRIPV